MGRGVGEGGTGGCSVRQRGEGSWSGEGLGSGLVNAEGFGVSFAVIPSINVQKPRREGTGGEVVSVASFLPISRPFSSRLLRHASFIIPLT